MSNLAQGTLTGSAKLQAVKSLMNKLTEDLESRSLSPQQRDALLEELKVYGRDPNNADPIFTKEGVETLTKHAFNNPSSTTSRNALRVLCNALFLRPETRQMFVDLGYEVQACNHLKNDNRDDEFLISRLIFLTTYNTTINLVDLVDQHRLAGSIIENLARHAERISSRGSKARADPVEDMALVETLKLLFNITHFTPDRVSAFVPAIPYIITILTKHDLLPSNAPLAPPFGQLVNALINLKFDDKDVNSSLYPEAEPQVVADRMVNLLDMSLIAYSDDDLETNVTPLISAIMTVHEHAPAEIRASIRSKLLPTEEDRKQVLGRGNSLTSRLLGNSTNPLTPKFRDAISHLLFDLSDKDANKFVQNVGYGYASGFLFQNNIPVPPAASDAGEDGRPVNPVTGQFIDTEKYADMPEMTDEEKEREAERLFVLFERLKRTGVMNVENPVERMYREGGVRKLKDDEVEEVDSD
ncbi:guanine nucleotide exchange factor [Coniochaeta sp. 2T2.1]|nr:guanine nucleotide exchange factor [Coniochaeta sp. 2T2.1]